MKEKIDVFDYANVITKAIGHGVLVTTQAQGRVNTMTIGWGTLGIEWSKPVFYCYIREGRATRPMIDESGTFTVSVPFEKDAADILRYCGSHSGREVDKIRELGLTLEEPQAGGAPGIAELPLTLECRVIDREKQELEHLDEKYRGMFYPQDVDSSAYGANRDAHIAYAGEIVAAYIIR